MNKKITMFLLSVILAFAFISCGEDLTISNTTTESTTITTEVQNNTNATETQITTLIYEEPDLTEQNPTVEDGYLVESPQDGTILHAWNWSMETVEENLEQIAIAGFSSVQISPMQPQKDYFGVASWGSSWWKFYQPLGFSIATENHALGTKTDLTSLCNSADEYGIKIIVDVVANHLAGGDNETLNEDIAVYEPEIYNNTLIHTDNGYVSDSSVSAVVQGALGGFPDLQTESQVVQDAVLDLLIEYVESGVDGFRFDAAKHIETPSDGTYASNFWPTIIDGVKTHAEGIGINDLYFYGEILNTAGTGREYSDYTDYMSITASEQSDVIKGAVTLRNADNVLNDELPTGVTSDQVVLWAESHDNYASGSTDDLRDYFMTKTYAITASKKDATSLYFVRPTDSTFIGECGTNLWESAEISNVNYFHNYFIDANELEFVEDGFYFNERYSDTKNGIVIVDVEENQTVSNVSVNHMPDGLYKDQVSGNIFVVEGGLLSGEVSENGVAVVMNLEYEPKPVAYVSDNGLHGSFSSTMDLTIYSYNTTEAHYSINGGDQIVFEGDTDVEISYPELNGTATLDIEVHYGDYVVTEHYEYVKSNIVIEEVTVNNLDTTIIGDNVIVAWSWSGTEDGAWIEGVYSDGTFTFDLPEGNDHFLLVTFASGTTSFAWSNKINQTNDVEITGDGTFDGSELVWA